MREQKILEKMTRNTLRVERKKDNRRWGFQLEVKFCEVEVFIVPIINNKQFGFEKSKHP